MRRHPFIRNSTHLVACIDAEAEPYEHRLVAHKRACQEHRVRPRVGWHRLGTLAGLHAHGLDDGLDGLLRERGTGKGFITLWWGIINERIKVMQHPSGRTAS